MIYFPLEIGQNNKQYARMKEIETSADWMRMTVYVCVRVFVASALGLMNFGAVR